MAHSTTSADGRPPPRSVTPSDVPERRTYDAVDRGIIELLSQDGRITNRLLAESLDLPETTISGRLRRLTDAGVLRVTAVTDWEAAGYAWCAAVCIKVEARPPRAVADDVSRLTEVFSVALVHGRFDVVAHVFLQDRGDMHRVLKEQLPSVAGVRELSMNLITRTVGYRTGTINNAVLEVPALTFPAPRVPLDEIDYGLIETLAHDGRQSNREVARQLGVSEGTIRSRVRRLENANLLRLVAVADREELGDIGSVAFIGIQVDGAHAEDVAAEVAAMPEAYMVNVTVGTYDVMVSAVTTRGDLGDFTTSFLPGIPGVRSAETLHVIDVPKHHYRWVRLLEPTTWRRRKGT